MIESSLQPSEMAPVPSGPGLKTARSAFGHGVAAALMLVSPLIVFAPAALFHCAVRNGRRAAWGAFAVATVLAGLAQVVAGPSSGIGAQMAWAWFATVVLSIGVPSMAVIPLVERGEPFGRVLMVAMAASAIGLGLTELIMQIAGSFSPYAIHLAQAQEAITRVIDFYKKSSAGLDMSAAEKYMGFVTKVLPASILAQFSLFFVLSLMMIGRLAAWRTITAERRTAVPAETSDRAYLFRNLSFPDWVLFGFVLGGLTPLTTGVAQAIAANVLALVLFLYLLQGLAIFRFVLVKAGAGVLGTLFGFALLAMLALTGIGVLLLIAVGLFDPFFDFRNLKRKDDADEGHTD